MQNSISFFIPAYNCALTVKEAIVSILETNFLPGDELIVVNDGSTDSTAEVLSDLKVQFPAIRVIHDSRNKGGAAARNTAVEASGNELLFCLDADNLLVENSIENLKKYQAETNADVVSFQEIQYFSESTSLIEEVWKLPAGEFSKEQALAAAFSPGAGGNYLFTKASWIKAGGYPEFAGALDTWGFGIRQLLTGSKVMVLENSFYFHRRLPGSYFLRDAWSRKKSISIRVTQLLIPFFDQLEDADIDYILGKKNRYTWFDNLDAHPIRLVKQPKSDPVFEYNVSAKPEFTLRNTASKVKQLVRLLFKRGVSATSSEITDIGSNGERLALERSIIDAKNPVIIFDIGANEGDYSLLSLELASQYKKEVEIHLFEPQKFNAAILEQKLGGFQNVVINQLGVSDKEESVSIFSEQEGSSLASVYNRKFFKEQNYTVSSEQIKLITLENYIRQKGLAKIDFMKIDVEGHELAAINGLGEVIKGRLIKAIQFEYGGTYLDAGTKLEEVYRVLSPYYNIGKITGDAVIFGPFTPQLEDFNYSNYLAVLKAEEHANV